MRDIVRVALLALVVLTACGEEDRVCLNGPCQVPGRPSQACREYVACWDRTSGSPGALSSSYGEGGSCWTNASFADACTSACISGLASGFPDAGC